MRNKINFSKTFVFLLVTALFIASTLFVACKNPFMPEKQNTSTEKPGSNNKDDNTETGSSSASKKTDAAKPTITLQPKNLSVSSDENFTLSVDATVSDGGTISYQWYRANDEKSEGYLILDAINKEYTTKYTLLGNDTEKVFYYYAIVTNTNDKVDGIKEVSVSSSRAKVTIDNKIHAKMPIIITQPKDFTGIKPDSLVLSVEALVDDEGELSYQWYKDDVKIDNAKNSTYEIPQVDLVGTKKYYVIVTNTNKNVNGNTVATTKSNEVTVSISEKVNAEIPSISLQPKSYTGAKKNITLSVVASVNDGGILSYQWYKNDGIKINGATLSSYEIPQIDLVGTTEYYVSVTNTNNNATGNKTVTINSEKAIIKIITDAAKPTIKTLQNITVKTGETFTLTADASVSDGGNLSYQWYVTNELNTESSKIDNATNKTYSSSFNEEKTVYYYVVVTNTNNNANGNKTADATSNLVKVTVNSKTNAVKPTIITQPISYTGAKQNITLTVEASVSDGGTLSYQWYKNDVLIANATSKTYVIPQSDLVGTNQYYVVVINTNNEVDGEQVSIATSDFATITIITDAAKPNILTNPSNLTVDNGKSFELSVSANSSDGGTLSYQWYIAETDASVGSIISSATNSTLSTSYNLKDSSKEESVYYYVVVTNTNNNVNGQNSVSVTSQKAKITVKPLVDAKPPVIVTSPKAYTGDKPDSFSLSVVATSQDGGVLSYQWYKSGFLIPGATNSTYNFPKSEISGTGYYTVTVTNTNNSVNGNKTASVTTDPVRVRFIENAAIPTISKNPISYNGTKTDKPLTVLASVSDNGTLEYQWYKAASSSDAGQIIQGATNSSYLIPYNEQVGSYYYYCKVTNKIVNNGDGGVKEQSVKSSSVLISFVTGLGYNHLDTSTESDYSPVDNNGSSSGYGWSTLTSDLGANVNGDETTFAVYSKNATKILLEIYDKAYGEDAKYDYWMEKGSDNIWRAKLRGAKSGTLYAFRAWGPNWTYDEDWSRGNSDVGFKMDYDSNGNRFNPNKVLFDPYAKEISHDKSNPTALGEENAGMYGTGSERYNGVVRNIFDTGKYAPKAVVIDDNTSFGTKPKIPQEKAIIYEAHARGITQHPSSANLSTILQDIDGFDKVVNIPDEYRGTYKGAGLLAPYLKALGVNTIELLPVHESDNDANPPDSPGGNYWAYMTYGYFAPDRRYSYDKSLGGPTKEFKEMVKAFHDVGMEVYLDVVFNHSGEGGTWYGDNDNFNTAELTFMRGLDNSTYYSLVPSSIGAYWETTGCGNNLRCDNPVVKNLVLDSLTYWIDKMGVDGYRFDLAPVLGREFDGTNWEYNPNAQLLKDIATLGNNKNAEMIAEAWDIGAYGVGTFPTGWGEWNGRYRDALRSYVGSGNRGSVNDFINGDYNNFNDQGGPHKTVNFVVAHDGFTLADLCSYEGNGNSQNSTLTWPFGPSDGGNGDYNSLGFGHEKYAKRQANRNYIAIQMMSRGIPMIVWGDEFSRTQNGNNNPYNIDSVATWSNYNMINTDSPHNISTGGSGSYHNNFGTFENNDYVNGNFMFMKFMLNLKANEPALNQANYNVSYNFRKEDGVSELVESDRCVWIHIDGSTVSGGSDYLVFMNMYTDQVEYTVPSASSGKAWVRVADTQRYFETDFNCWDDKSIDSVEITSSYGVAGWSVVILKEVDKRNSVANPVISGSGADSNGNFQYSTDVSITSSTSSTNIYYTTDGTIPSKSNGNLYNGAFEITKTTTIKAIAYKDGYYPSAVITKKFTNTATVETPVLSVPEGDFWNTITVFVTGATPGAKYYYTTNGSTPTSSSSLYSASTGIKISSTTNLKVVGCKSGLSNSSVVNATYTKQTSQKLTEDKSGVILQGFNWDSAPRGEGFNAENPNPKWYKWYKTLGKYQNDIKDNFEYVWFPPPSKTDTASSEGYAPTQLNDLNSCYGTETELKSLISAISPTKAIADIVVNHRAGTTSWGDFTNPKWNEDYSSITSDDEGFSSSNSPMYGSSNKGSTDSGMGYAAYRDLDHKNSTVQQGIYSWMNSVLKRVGFVGWRYDYVKGFGGEYVGYYNAMTDAAFSVGEYWPDEGTWSTLISNWVKSTGTTINSTAGKSSRAFDFVLKQKMNDAFGWYKKTDSGNDYTYDKAGDLALLANSSTLLRSNPSAAITFVDNHDTGSTQQHWELSWNSVPLAYTYILTHPGIAMCSKSTLFYRRWLAVSW